MRDEYNMKSVKNLFEEAMALVEQHGYKIRYVPHEIIEDYNATYNVIFENKHITGAARKLGIPLNEVWISEMWKPYEKYIVFHELREIWHRAKGLSRDEAHKKALQDGLSLWSNDPLLLKLIEEVKEMDKKTAMKKRKIKSSRLILNL